MNTNNDQMRDSRSTSDRRGLTGQLATAALLGNQVIAVGCQFVQHTDPRFPLWYFTVDSAILAGVAAAAGLAGPHARWVPALRHTAAVGVLVSALIFAAVIAPASPSGTWFQGHDDIPVRIATVLLHGVAPVLVIACCWLRPTGLRGRAAIGYAYLWPLAYLAGLCAMLSVRGPGVMPYPFLAPGQMGWGTVGLASSALTALIAASGAALGVPSRVGCRTTRAAGGS